MVVRVEPCLAAGQGRVFFLCPKEPPNNWLVATKTNGGEKNGHCESG